MKRKNLLVFLTAACLFGCQQQDNLQDPSKEAIDFSTSCLLYTSPSPRD